MRRLIPVVLVTALATPALLWAQTAAQAPAGVRVAGAFAALSVTDADATARWYVDKLGLRVTMQPQAPNGIVVRILEGNGIIVEILQLPDAKPPASRESHLTHGIFKAGFIVDDYDALLAALPRRGVPIELGPFPARDGQRANFIVRDNAGNLLQFFQR